MAKIHMKSGVALVDDADLHLVEPYKWFILWSSNVAYAATYVRTGAGRRQTRMHHMLIQPQQGLVIDHRDHNGLNNQRSNLRLVSLTTSNRNRRCRSANQTSAFKGVSWCRQTSRWKAHIRHEAGGRPTTIGRFDTEEQAAVEEPTGIQATPYRCVRSGSLPSHLARPCDGVRKNALTLAKETVAFADRRTGIVAAGFFVVVSVSTAYQWT